MKNPRLLLITGDLITLGAVTLVGFATHGEGGLALLPRMLASFVPLTVSWLLIGLLLGLFNPEDAANPRQLWKPAAGMLFAGPLAALLRALLLNTVVIPVFGLVLSASSALGILLWRALWVRLQKLNQPSK